MVDTLTVLIIVIGVIYGFSRKGAEDYIHILMKGLVIGLVIGVIIALIGFLAGGLIGGLVGGIAGGIIGGLGGLAFFGVIFIITVEFIIGALLGDIIEKVLR